MTVFHMPVVVLMQITEPNPKAEMFSYFVFCNEVLSISKHVNKLHLYGSSSAHGNVMSELFCFASHTEIVVI